MAAHETSFSLGWKQPGSTCKMAWLQGFPLSVLSLSTGEAVEIPAGISLANQPSIPWEKMCRLVWEDARGHKPGSLSGWCVPFLLWLVLCRAILWSIWVLSFLSVLCGLAELKHLQSWEFYNLFIPETKSSSSDCVQMISLHLVRQTFCCIKKILPVLHSLPLWEMCGCLVRFVAYTAAPSHAAKEMSFPFPLLQQSRHLPPE